MRDILMTQEANKAIKAKNAERRIGANSIENYSAHTKNSIIIIIRNGFSQIVCPATAGNLVKIIANNKLLQGVHTVSVPKDINLLYGWYVVYYW